MIERIDITKKEMAEKVINIQIPSYKIEAEIIDFYDIPPLKDTIDSLLVCGETFYGYFIDGKLVGAISFKIIGEMIDIHRLMVHPDYFRRGIAKELLQFVESKLSNNICEMIVSTGSKNTPAVKFYENFGFNREEEIKISDKLSITKFTKKY